MNTFKFLFFCFLQVSERQEFREIILDLKSCEKCDQYQKAFAVQCVEMKSNLCQKDETIKILNADLVELTDKVAEKDKVC